MRKIAYLLILVAWLIYIYSMFLPVAENGQWNGLRTTTFSLYAVPALPVSFLAMLKEESRGWGILVLFLGVYGLCNIVFLSSICLPKLLKSRIKKYRRILFVSTAIAFTSALWSSGESLKADSMGVGRYVWPLAFLTLSVGVYIMEKSKPQGDDSIAGKIKSTDNTTIEADRE